MQAASNTEAGEIICVLDALDECEAKAQEILIKTLKELFLDHKRHRGMRLKFLVSSRPYPIIERRFRPLTKDFPSIHLKGEYESDLISQEINLVRKCVLEIAMKLELSSHAEERFLDSLLDVPNRTYLWLHLIFEAILKSTGVSSAKAIEKIISQLPESLDEAYDKILARATNFSLCRRLLHIILAAQEPLTLMFRAFPTISLADRFLPNVDCPPFFCVCTGGCGGLSCRKYLSANATKFFTAAPKAALSIAQSGWN